MGAGQGDLPVKDDPPVGADRARFVPLPPPTPEDITPLTATTAARLTKRLRETIGKARESDAGLKDNPKTGLLQRAVQLALWLPRSAPYSDETTCPKCATLLRRLPSSPTPRLSPKSSIPSVFPAARRLWPPSACPKTSPSPGHRIRGRRLQ